MRGGERVGAEWVGSMSRQSSTPDRGNQPATTRRTGRTCGARARTPRERRRRGGIDRRHAARRAIVRRRGIAVLWLAIGWMWSIANAQTLAPARRRAAARSPARRRHQRAHARGRADHRVPHRRGAQRVTDRMLESARGTSGKLKADDSSRRPTRITPDTLPPGGHAAVLAGRERRRPHRRAPGSGTSLLAVGNAIRPVANFNLISMLPFSAKKNGRVGLYYIGNWPSEKGKVGPSKAPAWRVWESGGLHRGHAEERRHAGLRALQAARLPHARSAERLAEVPRAAAEAGRQARARSRRSAGARHRRRAACTS